MSVRESVNLETYHCVRVIVTCRILARRSQWPRGLRRGCAAARLQVSRVRIPPAAWRSVSCECCLLSGRGLCIGLITRPEKHCGAWRV